MSLEISETPHQRATAAAIEQKRLQEGLTHAQVTQSLGLSTKGYWNLRHGNNQHLSLNVVGRVAGWLAEPIEDVLRLTGDWERLSPVGRVLVPRMLGLALAQEQLAEHSGVDPTTISDMLWATRMRNGKQLPSRAPSDDVLERLTAVLGGDVNDLRRAAREMRQARPRHTSTVVARIRRREGQVGLQRRGERLATRALAAKQRLSPEQRAEHAQRSAEGLRDRWAVATAADRERWGILHLDPRPSGRFGLCRVCGKLTHRPGQSGRISEYHARCLAEWRSEGSEFGQWASVTWSARKAGHQTTPPPVHAYPDHRRLESPDLADYYAATALYVQVKLGGAVKIDGRIVHSVGELAEALFPSASGNHSRVQRKRATELLRQRVARLMDLLPDPSAVSDGAFGIRIRLLRRGLALAGGSGEVTTAGDG